MKRLALIAHDNKKEEMRDWCMRHKDALSSFELSGTGKTAALISEATGLKVKAFLGGPYGGDLEIGAAIAERRIDAVIFFWDPLSSLPHDPDIKALMRIAAVYDIPFATNAATADLLIAK
jgi:methylglyoxal synthase